VKTSNSTHAPPRRIDLNIESDPAQIAGVRRAVEQFAAESGLPAKAQAEVGLCVNEALANIIRHAYGEMPDKPIAIAAEWLDDGESLQSGPIPTDSRRREAKVQHSPALRVTIRDWGSGENPESEPPKPRDPLKPGGIGLLCLRQLMDEITYTPQRDGMLLTMVKRRPA